MQIRILDVATVLRAAPAGHYDAILLDLYEGPHAATQSTADPNYGIEALRRSLAALSDGGVLAVWSEEPDQDFEVRLRTGGPM